MERASVCDRIARTSSVVNPPLDLKYARLLFIGQSKITWPAGSDSGILAKASCHVIFRQRSRNPAKVRSLFVCPNQRSNSVMPAFGVREKKWSRNGSALPRLMTINVSLVYGTAWEDLTYAASEAACRQDVSAAKHALRFRLRSSCFVFFSPRHFYRKKCVLPPFSFSHFLFPWPLLLVYIGHQAADHYYIPSTVVVFTFPRTHDLRYRSKKIAPVYPLVVTNISSFVRYSFPARDVRTTRQPRESSR